MKKTRIVLVGALVLALAFVMGCGETPSSGTSEDWDPNTDTQKTWRKSNSDPEQTVRSFEGFGNLKVNNGAVVKIVIGNSKASKAGILFDYKEFSKENGTVCYYQFGVGTKGYDGETPEFYLTKVENIKPDDITASTTSESASGGKGSSTDIQDNISFADAFGEKVSEVTKMYEITTTGKMTTYAGFIIDEVAGEGNTKTKVVKLRLGWYDEQKKGWKEGAYIDQPLMDGAGWSGKQVGAIDGKLCAYGMLKKATKGEVSTENSYTLINKTGKMVE